MKVELGERWWKFGRGKSLEALGQNGKPAERLQKCRVTATTAVI
jgi:hypothetical protein